MSRERMRSGFWHSLAKIVAGVCDPGPSSTRRPRRGQLQRPRSPNPLGIRRARREWLPVWLTVRLASGTFKLYRTK